jgi:hypothetical protein
LAAFALLLAGGALAVSRAGAEEKPFSPTTQESRDKLVTLDAELRKAFGKAEAWRLPERKRKLPAVKAKSFDWIQVMGLTPVHYQGGKPSCVAQAAVAALEWNWQIRNGTKAKPMLSPQPILDRLQKDKFFYAEALDQLLRQGTSELALYPYTGEPQKPRDKVRTPYRLVGWGQVGSRGGTSVESMKQALLEHGPLVASVYASPAFEHYKGGVFAEKFRGIPDDQRVNHALVVIGWDDRLGKGCWHVQNSWGLKWGEAGGAWIEYGCNNIGYTAYWLRAQSTQYNLPADAHKLLGDGAAPFRRWPSARDVAAARN